MTHRPTYLLADAERIIEQQDATIAGLVEALESCIGVMVLLSPTKEDVHVYEQATLALKAAKKGAR